MSKDSKVSSTTQENLKSFNNKQSVSGKVPGRTVGFSVMSTLIIAAAFWMKLQSASNQFLDTALGSLVDVPGFKSDAWYLPCLLYTSPSPRDLSTSRMPSSA